MTTTFFADFDLDPQLLRALTEKGYQQPTQIQAACLPLALEGKDILGCSPTGTGKTAAYLLPAIQHLLDFPRKKAGAPRILILTPTRELAIQVAEQAKALAQHTSLAISTITGGVAYMNHAEIFSENQDIVIATTGRLLQYIREENFDCRAIEMLILDEADRMLDMGFAQDIEHIAGETRWRKQTLLFSATLDSDAVNEFASRVLNQAESVRVDASRRERQKILQWYYRADSFQHKFALLVHLLQQSEMTKTIVFIRKRERVHEIHQLLQQHQLNSCYLEGEMPQTKRNQAILRFNQGKTAILLATDVAARGLDIEGISHVINFDLPRTADIYLHRIGRTARAGKKGEAISLVEAHDYPLLLKIERYLHEGIKMRVIDSLRPTSKKPQLTGKKKPSKKQKAKLQEKKKVPKEKVRQRVQKNIGKRRQPSQSQEE